MPIPSREDAKEALAAIHALEAKIQERASFEQMADRSVKYIGWVWAYSAAIIAGTIWVWILKTDISSCQKSLLEQGAKISLLEAENRSAEKKAIAVDNTIERNREERKAILTAIELRLASLEKDAPKLQIMWSLKEHGKSNKEEFMRLNGYPAPENPEK